MLRNVLGAYLDSVTERQLNLPLLLLFPAMGYYDVHFTHGAAEHGKDFIAKKVENGEVVQYAFQSKIGDITQATWRNTILGQVLEALTTGISHANFDTSLPRMVVLITTGDLVGNAGNSVQSFKDDTVQRMPGRSLDFWGRSQLIERFERYGLAGAYRATAAGFADYGQFFMLYGSAMQGRVSDREIEEHSRRWNDVSLDRDKRLLLCALESEILAQQCIAQGFHYEAIVAHLARLRTLCALAYTDDASYAPPLYTEAIARLHDLCASYLGEIRRLWRERRDLLTLIVTATNQGEYAVPPVMTYPIQCARIIDIAALAFFTTTEAERGETASFLEEFILAEPGCCHPPGNRYTVGIVLAILILLSRNRRESVRQALHHVTTWLCDRYEQGVGLAGHEATEGVETMTLLAYPFASVEVTESRSSLLATAMCDLAAFLGDGDLFGDIVNDIKACDIYPEYWQPQDTAGVCSIESADVTHVPNVEFADVLTDFHRYEHAPHLLQEPESFHVADLHGATALVVLMVLLRDRYFPKLWPVLI